MLLQNILVSINCITYNHEEFIAEAIESFLMQKTNFNYEILIHDDASTDSTAEIIREYEKKYPDLIKPIYQKENQYSKGNPVDRINMRRAKGKYIAICEGDDYWLDPYKLQKQTDYMEKHPECSLCVHGGEVVNASEKKTISYNSANKGNKDFRVEEVIEGGGALFITNSMFYPFKFHSERPKFLDLTSVGDYPLAINLSLLGTVHYLDEFMSAYREGVSGSWTDRNMSSLKRKTEHYDEIANMLDEVNQYTNYQYENSINKRKYTDQLFLLLEQGKFREAKTGKYKDIYLELGYKKKIFIFMDQYCSSISKVLRVAKRRLIR
ncbi:glycosyl transferase family 2 [Lysinibacillus contaminans]|uniref:Glycosyl transferase family 2 n=1 Tax=Lysinibacillus contaminans TaxID=1293441 RepID=A0ABR5K4K0_9BACI|nr:glycosyl transferase family 2 [Lysinibacillus contaminans]